MYENESKVDGDDNEVTDANFEKEDEQNIAPYSENSDTLEEGYEEQNDGKNDDLRLRAGFKKLMGFSM